MLETKTHKLPIAWSVLLFVIAITGCLALTACTSANGASSGSGNATSSASEDGSTATESTSSASAGDATYADTLFDTSYVHTIDIAISDED